MEYFKLGVDGEGFTFFIPDGYRNIPKTIGTGIRRTISGTAKTDIVAIKRSFELTFDYVTDQECIGLYAQFLKFAEEGKNLTFYDDEGGSYQVVWGTDVFGLDTRIKSEKTSWSGMIVLEEV